MKFEQVLPALREGQAITHPDIDVDSIVIINNKLISWSGFRNFEARKYKADINITDQFINALLDDKWEVKDQTVEEIR